MSCNRTSTRNTCGRPRRRFTTLASMVGDFILKHRSREDSELASFKEEPFDASLERAALAKDAAGKRFSHQRRLTRESLVEAKHRLMSMRSSIESAESFSKVLEIVRRVASGIHGLGDLYSYDTALRISAALGHEPEGVFLHAGTRVGAKRLGLPARGDYLSLTQLPSDLRVLKAHEVESFLCIYKNQFGVVTRRTPRSPSNA